MERKITIPSEVHRFESHGMKCLCIHHPMIETQCFMLIPKSDSLFKYTTKAKSFGGIGVERIEWHCPEKGMFGVKCKPLNLHDMTRMFRIHSMYPVVDSKFKNRKTMNIMQYIYSHANGELFIPLSRFTSPRVRTPRFSSRRLTSWR